MTAALSRLGLLLLLIAAALVGLGAACNGNRRPAHVVSEPRDGGTAAANASPTVRIYYLVDLDGYLEPCGCQSRPLGGIDRVAAFMQSQSSTAPHAVLAASGNLLYRDPTLDPRMEFQEASKADSIVHILDQLGLVAFAPGPSDFVRGAQAWQHSIALGHAVAVAANVSGPLASAFRPALVREIDGVRVGFVGVSDFRETPDATPPAGSPDTSDPMAAARAGVDDARRQGARIVVVLASVPRRIARSIAGDVPGVNFVVAAREEGNAPQPPERIGDAYLVTAPNQGKALGIIDVYVRDGGTTLVDASEATAAATRVHLDARIQDLAGRIAAWRHDPTVDRAAVAQQEARLETLRRERAALAAPHPPEHGSYFVARVQEIAPELPKRPDVQQTIANYFRTVNEHNRAAYANLSPPPPQPGQPFYVGMEACRDCHEETFDIWVRTPHSEAYRTIEVVNKNFNLSCVGCHVTGYRQPGGAEVVQNEGRRDVQCESCHGPGSAHIRAHGAAQFRATIRREVPASFCATQCHTPEHSDHFDYATYLPRILGPGHGFPVGSDGGAVRLDAAILQGGATPPNDSPDASASAAMDAAATH